MSPTLNYKLLEKAPRNPIYKKFFLNEFLFRFAKYTLNSIHHTKAELFITALFCFALCTFSVLSPVQFSHSVVSDSLQWLQHARLPCPSPTPGTCSDSWDTIQPSHPSHPLSSLSPPAFHRFHHQGLFQGVSSSNQVIKVLGFQLQHQSFQWIFRTDFL